MSSQLQALAAALKSRPLKQLAAARAGRSVLTAAGWSADLSRHFLDESAEAALLAHGKATGLDDAAARLFNADIVNPSEGRPALHWALRAQAPLSGEAETVRQSVLPALEFAAKVQSGEVQCIAGTPYRTVLHIGIGGSDFGPRLIADAFADRATPGIDLRFCANVDPWDLDRALNGIDPATTLVVGVSKSFGTEETLYNLGRARSWMEAELGEAAGNQFALVTANPAKAKDWLAGGDAYLFDMPLSVGGRFSLWSAASLACMIYLQDGTFQSILEGASMMDDHVRNTPLESNMAMRLALLDFWNTSIVGQKMRVQLAYANRLRMLPTYLQQLEMESNGKSVGPDGKPVPYATAPALWGGEGSVGQHSYHQWLHQGSQDVPCEFILAPDLGRDAEGIIALTSHALAQAEVLANGRSLDEVKREEPDLADAVAQQKVHAGGRASTFMYHKDFGPEAFGSLVSLFEHRTYFAGHLWGLNPFDQWGVERGKTMAGRLKGAIQGNSAAEDPVTAALLRELG
ncbi:MAG: glucose-6-phosphate isomerase [Hyphomonas sp.]|uniref:glucose-6-phosphate isomerase n=1 Tax=Hyphomonas sp. TaxID=87 RepID=UPI003526C9FC